MPSRPGIGFRETVAGHRRGVLEGQGAGGGGGGAPPLPIGGGNLT